MKMFDVEGNLVNVDVRESKYPVRGQSKSALQGETARYLDDLYPYEPLLEEFTIPGSHMSVDFFLPRKGIVVEVQGIQHDEFVPHFHGDKLSSDAFAKQKHRDVKKRYWAELNDFKFFEIRTKKDLEQL